MSCRKVRECLTAITAVFTAVFTSVKTVITAVITAVKTVITAVFTSVKTVITAGVTAVFTAVTTAARRIVISLPNFTLRILGVSRFFVSLVGVTNGAHLDFVKKLKGVYHIEVNSPEECDYTVVFCPIASRVGTDVTEALNKTSDHKPTILVVMHHTFDPDHVVADSGRLVVDPNVHLTVDCLFYEGHLLQCKRNDAAWDEVKKKLGVSLFQVKS